MTIITDIVNEENVHVGQLQQALQLISPNAASIDVGKNEASKQIVKTVNHLNTFEDTLHPGMSVQTHQPTPCGDISQSCDDLSAECSICDIDDTF